MEKEKTCSVEERNKILKKPMLGANDIAKLFCCSTGKAYRQIEIINRWLKSSGKGIIEKKEGERKYIRTVDYLDFCGLPHSLME